MSENMDEKYISEFIEKLRKASFIMRVPKELDGCSDAVGYRWNAIDALLRVLLNDASEMRREWAETDESQ